MKRFVFVMQTETRCVYCEVGNNLDIINLNFVLQMFKIPSVLMTSRVTGFEVTREITD